jgi:hypothetical protein
VAATAAASSLFVFINGCSCAFTLMLPRSHENEVIMDRASEVRFLARRRASPLTTPAIFLSRTRAQVRMLRLTVRSQVAGLARPKSRAPVRKLFFSSESLLNRLLAYQRQEITASNP